MVMNVIDKMRHCHSSCPCLGGISVYEEEEEEEEIDCVNV